MSSSDEEVDVSDQATIRPLNVVHSDHANSSSSENSNSGNEGAATSGGSSNSSPSASSSLRALHPHKPVIAALRPQHPQPMAPPARPADPEVVARKKAQVTPVGPSPSSPPPGDAIIAEPESVQQQVCNFLLSKNGACLTPEEYRMINTILGAMVTADAVPLESSPLDELLHRDVDTQGQPIEAPEKPIDESAPVSSEKASDEPVTAIEKQDVERPAEGQEESPSPVLSTHGLPPFHLGHDSNGGTSKAQSTDEQSTEDEDAKFDKRLQKRTVEIRRYLNLDYTDYNDVDGWGDLLRYKDVPRKYWTPEMLEAHTIAHGSPEVTAAPEVEMEHSSTESVQEDVPQPEPTKPTKDVKQPKDFTKGYTPVEAMVNPYERIAAFARRRKQPHKIPAQRQQTAEPMDTTTEPSDNSVVLPLPELPKEILGRLNLIQRVENQKATGYNDEPVEEEPPRNSGITGLGRKFTEVKKRKAASLYLEIDDEALGSAIMDAPTAQLGPRPPKRRKSEEHPDLDDQTPPGTLVDINMQNIHVLDEYDDHTPVKRVAKIPAPPAKSLPLEKQKWKPKIKSLKRGKGIARNAFRRTRSKNFLNPPIIPSPLRPGAKSRGRKLLSRRLLQTAAPKEKATVTDKMPSYEFSPSSSRIGSIGPIRASREMVQAKREVNSRKPYTLPEYRRAFKHLNKSPKSTLSSLANIDIAATLVAKKPSKTPRKVNGTDAHKPTPTPIPIPQEEKSVPAPTVAELVEVFEIRSIVPTPKQNGVVPGAGAKKDKELLTLKPIVKLDIPPPVRKLTAAPSAHARQMEWAIAGRSPMSDRKGQWCCSKCLVGNRADAELCINCSIPRVQVQVV